MAPAFMDTELENFTKDLTAVMQIRTYLDCLLGQNGVFANSNTFEGMIKRTCTEKTEIFSRLL